MSSVQWANYLQRQKVDECLPRNKGEKGVESNCYRASF